MKTITSVFACLVGSLFAAAEPSEEFRAGYSRVDITPPAGIPRAGDYRHHVLNGVNDPLYARTVAFSDGSRMAAVVSVDNLMFYEFMVTNVKAFITAKTGLSPAAVFIHCTHTHTGPMTSTNNTTFVLPEERSLVLRNNERMAQRISDGVKLALDDLAPAKILVGRGEARDISFIRRFKMKDGTTCTNPGVDNPDIDHPIGTPDEQLQLVRFVREGRPEIALVNFQCHPCVVGGLKCSADWPGMVNLLLERAFDGKVVSMVVNGAQGDTNHVRAYLKKGETRPRPYGYNPISGYGIAWHMARTIAGSALQTWGTCVEVPPGRIGYGMRQVRVEANVGKPEEKEEAHRIYALFKSGQNDKIPGKGMAQTTTIARACRIVALETKPDHVLMPVSAVTIGTSLAFGGFPGEPFTQIGRDLKAHSPFAMTVPACVTNGAWGYFPLKSCYDDGGYEVASSPHASGTAERLLENQLAQLRALHESATR